MGIIIQQSNLSQVELKPSVVEDGLVMYYDMANQKSYPNTGTEIFNLAHQDIQITDSGSLNGTTVSNNALIFDGSDDRVDMEETIVLSRSGMTLMWWMKPHTIKNMGLFSISETTNPVLKLIEFRQSSFYAETNNNCNYFNSPSFTTFSSNEWRHVAVRFLNNEAHWYIDGSNIGETPDYGKFDCDPPNNYAVSELVSNTDWRYISGGTYSDRFDGEMNHIMLYNRGLDDTEVSQNYTALRHRY